VTPVRRTVLPANARRMDVSGSSILLLFLLTDRAYRIRACLRINVTIPNVTEKRVPYFDVIMDGEYTIDELATASGLSTRNLRSHHARGLLPSPEVRGRVGYYNDEHLARLRLIERMRADGFNLSAIRRLLDSIPQGSATEIADADQAIRTAWVDEEPEELTAPELAVRVRERRVDPKLLQQALDLKVVRPIGGGVYEVPSPTLLRVAEQLVSMGVPVASSLSALGYLDGQSRVIARRFITLFLREVWPNMDDSGQAQELLRRLKPLAVDALAATFRIVMEDETQQASLRVARRRRRKAMATPSASTTRGSSSHHATSR
jgi:DNA-binding transcriptional MerR regulator